MDLQQREKKYTTGEILLDDGTWLVFKREQQYSGYYDDNDDAITVRWFDNYNQTNTLLGTLYSNHWVHPNPQNAKMFWHYIKRHSRRVKGILVDLQQPLEQFPLFKAEWTCFKRKFKLESIKLNRKANQISKQ